MKEMPYFDQLNEFLKALPSKLPETPRALLVISGHWEEDELSVTSGAEPAMVYDYGGFPEHTYHIRYAAPGNPELAASVQSLLRKAGIPVHLDPRRGFDHGAFTVAYPMFPKANVPMIQLSLKSGYDSEFHLRMGKALAPLRNEGVLIIGSGLSYHNMRGFQLGAEGSRVVTEQSRHFDDWLNQSLVLSSPEERRRKLVAWEKAPDARAVHPQEDHLIPLMVAVGAAEDEKATLIYHELLRGVMCSSFRFG
jgi:aromatic ring-opening dioxygenase catalytic subunit (LigB family)